MKNKQTLFENLNRVSGILHDSISTSLIPYNITSQQFNLIRILRGAENQTLCAKEIRDRLVDKHADVSRLITRCEDKKWIRLKQSKVDRRQKNIYLTESAIELMSKIEADHPNFPYHLTANINDEEILTLCNLLEKWIGQ